MHEGHLKNINKVENTRSNVTTLSTFKSDY